MPVYTNLATNPSFETADGTVTVRTNLATNPGVYIDIVGYNSYGVASPVRDTTVFETGIASIEYTGLGSSDAGPSYIGFTYAASKTYTALMRVKTSNTGVNYHAQAVGTDVDTSTRVDVASTGDWQTYTTTFTVIASPTRTDGAYPTMQVILSGHDETADIWVDRITIVEGTVSADFDGDTDAAGDFSYAWTGTANASTSIQTAPGVAGVTGDTCYQSQEWAASGTYSLYVPDGDTGTIDLTDTSTALVTARSTGQTLTVGTTDVTSTAAEQVIRATDDTSVILGPGYWDCLLIVEVPDIDSGYTGDYFDGNTTSTTNDIYAWTDTADASTSTWTAIVPVLTANPDAAPPSVAILFDSLDSDTQTITVYSIADDTRTVKGAVNKFAAGGFSVTDYLPPLGVDVVYRAEQFDSSGVSLGFTDSATVNLAAKADYAWFQDPLDPSTAVKVVARGDFAENYTRIRTMQLYQLSERTVGLFGPQSLLQNLNLHCGTETLDDADMLQTVLSRPFTAIRTVPPMRTPRVLTVAIGTGTETDIDVQYGGEWVDWPLTGNELSQSLVDIVVPVVTLGRYTDNFDTFGDFEAAYLTFLDADANPPAVQDA